MATPPSDSELPKAQIVLQIREKNEQKLYDIVTDTKLAEQVAGKVFESVKSNFYKLADSTASLPTYFSPCIYTFPFGWESGKQDSVYGDVGIPLYRGKGDHAMINGIISQFLILVVAQEKLRKDMDGFFESTNWKYSFSIGRDSDKVSAIFCKVWFEQPNETWSEAAQMAGEALSLGYVETPHGQAIRRKARDSAQRLRGINTPQRTYRASGSDNSVFKLFLATVGIHMFFQSFRRRR